MEIRRILSTVVRKWRVVVLLAVLGGGLSFLSVYFAKPIYQADTKLYIMTGKTMDLQDFTVSQYLVQQYTQIISSRTVTSAILRDLKTYSITEKGLLSMIHIVTIKDSNIVTISATNPDPATAAAIANATGREFTAQLSQITNTINVGILDDALVPNYPVSNQVTMKVLLGLLAGLMVAFGIIFVIEYFDTTIRSVEDIVNGLNVRVIGIIPEHDIR